ncbi:MAG: magnesium transporter, partial [Planctomycetes bacterium]|nr:magnesium transporter [Planctomycetota bacterium]
VRREIASGLLLGGLLGLLGFALIAGFQFAGPETDGIGYFGPHWLLVGTTVGMSILGCVTWGTVAGSMLPFILRRVGLDPASASAPMVATMVDVCGILIYFTAAAILLRGTLL